ncbi:MAG TPA: hypothetical protein VK988_15180, partial [Acidimicrobiales bacterium]|nr:hypothetical protein [Acidimicrobiales bacterium]
MNCPGSSEASRENHCVRVAEEYRSFSVPNADHADGSGRPLPPGHTWASWSTTTPPAGPSWAASAYLSGDVRAKLAAARVAAERDERFAVNVAALERGPPGRPHAGRDR